MSGFETWWAELNPRPPEDMRCIFHECWSKAIKWAQTPRPLDPAPVYDEQYFEAMEKLDEA